MKESYFEVIKGRMIHAASWTNFTRRDNDINRNHTNYGACTAWAEVLHEDMNHHVDLAVYEEDGFLLVPSITIDGETIRFLSTKTRNTTDPVENMKELIERYCEAEFGPEDLPDFGNMNYVPLAYTTTEDDKHTIQAAVDLINLSLITKVDDVIVGVEQWEDIKTFTEECLENLDFSELVRVSDEEITKAERTRKNNHVED